MNVHKILFFILFAIGLLAVLCLAFPKEGFAVHEHRFFFPTLEEVMVREKSQSAGDKMRALEESMRMWIHQDSLNDVRKKAYNAYQDSLSFYMDFFTSHPSRIHFPDTDFSFFNSLFENLDRSEQDKKMIHILHYGDSQIEGDRITGFFRQKMQEKFGGRGAGLIPVVQTIPSASVAQTASENIERYTIAGNHANRTEHNRYGVLGQTAHIHGYGQLSINARNWKNTFENVKDFSRLRIFVTRNDPKFSVSLSAQGKEADIKTIENVTETVSVLTWDFSNPVKRISINISGSGEMSAISLDSKYGVAVDNIPLRGSSGTFFTGIDSKSLSPVLKELNTRLIILQFGGNSIPGIKTERQIESYKQQMARQIRFFQKICPEAKILLIGPSDMSTKIDGRLQSYPLLAQTAQALKEAALENGAAFWNMYEVMGGENSMIEWVNNKPALAAPDYIHFTPRGSDRIAEIFFESLMIYYDYYHFMTDPAHITLSEE
jgi:Lysophospholipase L1 and related esterases